MNVVDFIILGIVGVSILFGLYKGFVNAVLGLVGLFVALGAAYMMYPQLARRLQEDESLIRTLTHYTDALSRVGDLDLSLTPVAGMTQQALNDILQRAALPAPFDAFVRANVTNQVFASLGSVTISQYLNQTIIAVSINILCFLVSFGISYAAVMLLVHLISYVFQMPVLKHLDLLLGGVFGGIRGIFLVFVLFALVPILLTVSPIEQVSQYISESRFAGMFYKSNIIQTIMQGTLF